MIIAVIQYCLTIAWSAPACVAPNCTFSHCDFYLDGHSNIEGVTTNEVSLCLQDFDPHTARVVCYGHDAEGALLESEFSDRSEPFQIQFKHPAATGRVLDACEQADLDWDGTVGFLDYGAMIQCFGAEHD